MSCMQPVARFLALFGRQLISTLIREVADGRCGGRKVMDDARLQLIGLSYFENDWHVFVHLEMATSTSDSDAPLYRYSILALLGFVSSSKRPEPSIRHDGGLANRRPEKFLPVSLLAGWHSIITTWEQAAFGISMLPLRKWRERTRWVWQMLLLWGS